MPSKKNASQRKYSKAAGEEVHKELHEFKQGSAHSGKGLAPVESREQAIAIGLSKARQKGEKAPAKSMGSQCSSKERCSSKGAKTSECQPSSKSHMKYKQ